MGLKATDMRDLIVTTQNAYPFEPMSYAATQEFSNYSLNDLFDKKAVKIQSGHTVVCPIRLDESGAADFIDLYEASSPANVDVMGNVSTPWKYIRTHYQWDRNEILMNRTPAKIADLQTTKRAATMESMANKLENAIWTCPVSETNKQPYGIPYWMPPATASGTTGFSGVANTNIGGNTVGSINADTYSRWKSYQDVWDVSDGSITKTGMSRMREMARKTNFKAPNRVGDLKDEDFRTSSIYVNNTTMLAFEEFAADSNDSIGFDIGKFQDAVSFNRRPIIYVAKLDDDSTNPMYFLNHKHIKPYILSGMHFFEQEPLNDVDQPTVYTVYISLTFNIIVTNRRNVGGIMSYVA